MVVDFQGFPWCLLFCCLIWNLELGRNEFLAGCLGYGDTNNENDSDTNDVMTMVVSNETTHNEDNGNDYLSHFISA